MMLAELEIKLNSLLKIPFECTISMLNRNLTIVKLESLLKPILEAGPNTFQPPVRKKSQKFSILPSTIFGTKKRKLPLDEFETDYYENNLKKRK